MYEEHVLSHYGEPYHKGAIPPGDLPAHAAGDRSDICGDEVHYEVRIGPDGRIQDIYWTGDGCCFSQAAASMLAKHFDGKTIDDVQTFTEGDMLKLFRAECSAQRKGCVLVSLNALKQIMELHQ